MDGLILRGKPPRLPHHSEFCGVGLRYPDAFLAIAGEAWRHERGILDRDLMLTQLFDFQRRPGMVLLQIVGSPFRGSVAWTPRSPRGDGPAVFRMDSGRRISRRDRVFIATMAAELLKGVRA